MLFQINFGNGTVETLSYNDRLQMTGQSLNRSSEILQKYDYFYGTVDLSTGSVDAAKNNNQLGKIEGGIGTDKQWTQKFKNDELGRLKEAAEYNGSI